MRVSVKQKVIGIDCQLRRALVRAAYASTWNCRHRTNGSNRRLLQ